jgi:hypothetical protein
MKLIRIFIPNFADTSGEFSSQGGFFKNIVFFISISFLFSFSDVRDQVGLFAYSPEIHNTPKKRGLATRMWRISPSPLFQMREKRAGRRL